MISTTELSLSSLEINRIEAILEMMFLAAWADGEVSAAERAAFRAQIVAGTIGELQVDVVESILAVVEENLAHAGREERLAAIRDRLKDVRMREAALDIAARILRADGQLHERERAFLERAARALDLDPALARALLAKPA